MEIALAVLAWLKSNWKTVVIGLAIAAAVTYVFTLRLQVQHYKQKADALTAQLQSVKDQSAVLEKQLASANKKLQDAIQREVDKQIALIENESKVAERNIKDDKVSRSIAIPESVVRLFNATVGGQTARAADSTPPANVEAGSTATNSVAQDRTVNDLLQVSAVNNRNHLICNEQVTGWQNFWIGYVQSLGYTPPTIIENDPKVTWSDLRAYATS